jgi:UDP-glucose 4-epimerase
MKPQVLAITGVSGYFGRILMPLLQDDPTIEKIIGIDIQAPDVQEGWEKLEFHTMDIRDPDIETLLADVDVLVHLAFVLMRLPGDKEIDDINVRGTQNVIEIAGRLGVPKIIVTSSTVAYGINPDNPVPLLETSPLRPNKDLYYSYAKAANEAYLDTFCKDHPEILVTRLRPPTVVGPNAKRELMAQVVADVIPVIRGYSPLIKLLHEEDLAQAIHLAIREDLPGIYNVTSDEPRSMDQLAALRSVRTLPLPNFIVRGMSTLLWRLGLTPFAPEFVDLLSKYTFITSNEKLKATGWTPNYTTPDAYLSVVEAFGKDGK